MPELLEHVIASRILSGAASTRCAVEERGAAIPLEELRLLRILRLRYASLTPYPTRCVGDALGGMLAVTLGHFPDLN